MTAPLADLIKRYQTAVPPCDEPIPDGETPEDRAERLRLQARNRRVLFDRAMPAEFRNATVGQLDPEYVERVGGWLGSPSRTLVLSGPVGVGKTHAAYAVMRAAADAGNDVAAWAVADLLTALQPEGDATAQRRSRTCSVLLIDDLGSEKSTEWRVEQIGTLLDARVREARRQVITTNHQYDDLAQRYGERVMSRLTGGATVVRMVGPDRRRTSW
jgi:DNA replication protein DnaC